MTNRSNAYTLYYAYGSNMSTRRLRERVESAQAIGTARLRGKRWACNKLGRDGTGKANLVDDPTGLVWGVLWRIDPGEWPRIDRFEGGYQRVEVHVETVDGGEHRALTYVSERLTQRPVPSAPYRDWLLEGAREHGLPDAWIELLTRLATDEEGRR